MVVQLKLILVMLKRGMRIGKVEDYLIGIVFIFGTIIIRYI